MQCTFAQQLEVSAQIYDVMGAKMNFVRSDTMAMF